MSEALRSDSADAARDRVLQQSKLTARHDVRIALEAGFEIDEVLWMLDLAEPPPGATVNGENFAEAVRSAQTNRPDSPRPPVTPRADQGLWPEPD